MVLCRLMQTRVRISLRVSFWLFFLSKFARIHLYLKTTRHTVFESQSLFVYHFLFFTYLTVPRVIIERCRFDVPIFFIPMTRHLSFLFIIFSLRSFIFFLQGDIRLSYVFTLFLSVSTRLKTRCLIKLFPHFLFICLFFVFRAIVNFFMLDHFFFFFPPRVSFFPHVFFFFFCLFSFYSFFPFFPLRIFVLN